MRTANRQHAVTPRFVTIRPDTTYTDKSGYVKNKTPNTEILAFQNTKTHTMKKIIQKLPFKKSKVRNKATSGPVPPVASTSASNTGDPDRVTDGNGNDRRELVEGSMMQVSSTDAATMPSQPVERSDIGLSQSEAIIPFQAPKPQSSSNVTVGEKTAFPKEFANTSGVDVLQTPHPPPNVSTSTSTSTFSTFSFVNPDSQVANLQSASISPDGTNSKRPAKTQHGSENGVGRYCKAVLGVLGCITSVPTENIADETDKDGSTNRIALKEQCQHLLESIEPFIAPNVEGCKIPASSVQKLHDILSHALEKLKDDAVDTASLGREISWKLEAFLVKVHWAGYISSQEVVEKVDVLLGSQQRIENFASTQAIASLTHISAAYDDYPSGDQIRVECFEGTRTALIEEIAEWFEDLNDSKMYVLAGPAGTGKSTIAQTVATKADGDRKSLRYLGASFFFSRNEGDRQNAQKFFTTIAFQLCVHYPEFARAITEVLKTPQGLDAVHKMPLEQLKALIIEPLRKFRMSDRRPVVIVVDALDECRQEDQQTVFIALQRLIVELPFFKVFLTTRETELQYLDSRVVRLQDIEKRIVEGDIRRYLKYHLSWEHVYARLPHLRKEWSATKEDIDCLVRATGNLFIVASTAVHYILHRNPSTQMRNLRVPLNSGHTPFIALHNFYDTILQSLIRINPSPLITEQYQQVVGTIVHIQHPLHIEALALLIDIEVDDITTILSTLKSVILLSADDIPLIYHKSFPDYLEEGCNDVNLRIGKIEQNTRITIRCFQVMNEGLRRNILELGSPARFMNNEALLEAKILPRDFDSKIPPHLQYACAYWANHFRDADRNNSDLKKQVDTFANTHLLHWFETLSWMHKLGLVHGALNDLLAFSKLALPGLSELLSDGLRFIAKFFDIIQNSALHTYYSALPFTPTATHLYKQYIGHLKDNLCQVYGGPEQWDTLIVTSAKRTLLDHQRAVKFSRDGSLFADFQGGHDVQVRHAASGVPIITFHGDRVALSDDFSIAAQSSNTMVEVYQIATNALINTWDLATDVWSLNLSHDGSRLAICSTDRKVSLWDTNSGKNIISHDDSGWDLAFSPSNYRFAYETKDNKIKLCDGANGDTIASLASQSQPYKLVFSPDGSRIASLLGHGLPERTLALWNAEDGNIIASVCVAEDSGETMASFHGCIAFSPDGSMIATAINETGFVKLWSALGEKLLSPIDSLPVTDVKCLAFSHNILAVGSRNIIRLYGTEARELKATLPFDDPHSLAISPDFTRLAAKDLSGLVTLWDLSSIDKLSHETKESSKRVSVLAFTPDCSRLAVGFNNGTIELWDMQHKGKVITSYNADSNRTKLAFSPDGQQLASGSWEVVQLWKSEDGTPIKTIAVNCWDLLFSGDTLLISSSEGIKLWDLRTHCIIDTFGMQGANHLSLSDDKIWLVTATNVGSFVYYLELWNLATRSKITALRFSLRRSIQKIIFATNNPWSFAITIDDGSLKVFAIDEGDTIKEEKDSDLSSLPIPHWQGAHMTLARSTYRYGSCVLGQFPGSQESIPVLRIPINVAFRQCESGSSMFALGYKNGRVLTIQPAHHLS